MHMSLLLMIVPKSGTVPVILQVPSNGSLLQDRPPTVSILPTLESLPLLSHYSTHRALKRGSLCFHRTSSITSVREWQDRTEQFQHNTQGVSTWYCHCFQNISVHMDTKPDRKPVECHSGTGLSTRLTMPVFTTKSLLHVFHGGSCA